MFGIDDAIIGAVGGSLISGFLNNSGASARQSDAQGFTAQQYATRYQTTVKDMQKAGLNPMLAYSQLGSSSPTSSAASSAGYPDMGAGMSQARMTSAQVANIAADTENKKAQANLIDAQAFQARASAWQSMSQDGINQMMIKDITAKLESNYWQNDAEKVRWITNELKSRYDLNDQKGMTEQQNRDLMRAQIKKIAEETDLLKLDKAAADQFNNLGRNMKELRPIIDILKHFIK